MVSNLAELERQWNPIIILPAQHNCAAAAKGTEDEAESLSSRLYLSTGVRLIVTCNLLTSFDLVSGTMGILDGIVWRSGNDTCTTLPCMLLFTPDHYSEDGPCLFRDINIFPVVPLLPITQTWSIGVANILEQCFRLYWHIQAFPPRATKGAGGRLRRTRPKGRGHQFSLSTILRRCQPRQSHKEVPQPPHSSLAPHQIIRLWLSPSRARQRKLCDKKMGN